MGYLINIASAQRLKFAFEFTGVKTMNNRELEEVRREREAKEKEKNENA